MESAKKLKWLGGTLDDAAGEAFDKTARLLGFENRGGLAIQEAAKEFINCHPELVPGSNSYKKKVPNPLANGRHDIKQLPRPMICDNSLNFSFSGLKTAILREVNKLKAMKQWNNEAVKYLAFEVQEAITDVLVTKTLKAVEKFNVKSILLSGGVAANLRLREKFSHKLQTVNYELFVPPTQLCTDNAVYIASCAYFYGKKTTWDKIEANPNLSVEI